MTIATRKSYPIPYTSVGQFGNVQIKNIKLIIVTDIKVTFNSLSAFGFRNLAGGRVYF